MTTQTLESLFSLVERMLLEGLNHGHFKYTIECSVGNRKERRVVIDAGKQHQIIIEADQLRPAA